MPLPAQPGAQERAVHPRGMDRRKHHDYQAQRTAGSHLSEKQTPEKAETSLEVRENRRGKGRGMGSEAGERRARYTDSPASAPSPAHYSLPAEKDGDSIRSGGVDQLRHGQTHRLPDMCISAPD